MNVLFIQQDVFKKYGLMALSSVLKANGHRCELLVDVLEENIMDKIRVINPDIVCFSVPSARVSWVEKLAKKIKSCFAVLIVVGGPHATFFPDIINNDHIDVVCRGEGDYALLELVNKLEKGGDITSIKNLWVKKNKKVYKNPLRGLIRDLDELPFADRELYLKYDYFRNLNSEVICTSRGCPYGCAFCYNKEYNLLYQEKRNMPRRNSVSRVISEIKSVVGRRKCVDHLTFIDNTFILCCKEWFDEFCVRYEEINIPFSITVRADLITEEVIRKLKKTGCSSVRMGIESGNPYLREKVLKKSITNKQILHACRLIKKYNLLLETFFIVGIPGETIKNALETYELSLKIRPDFACCSLLHPYHGTEVRTIAAQQGLIGKGYDTNYSSDSLFYDLPLNLKNKKELISLQRLFQFGNAFRIPKDMMRVLIKIPPNMLFSYVFQISHGLGLKKILGITWINAIKTAINSKAYF